MSNPPEESSSQVPVGTLSLSQEERIALKDMLEIGVWPTPHKRNSAHKTSKKEVLEINCTWLSRAWCRYLRDLLSPRPCNLTLTEFLVFLLTWNQHHKECNRDRCYTIFSSTVSPLLPITQPTSYITLPMIMAKHQESYLSFLNTFHHLNIPKGDWNIVFSPNPLFYLLGNKRLEMAKNQGFISLYFATSNPLLLEEHPFEEIILSDTDNEEEALPPPSPSSSLPKCPSLMPM
jgi:hypothetical protein